MAAKTNGKRSLWLPIGAVVLCPLSVGAATIGGLFGPPGIWIYAGIVSLPAWLVLWLLRWRARRLAALGGSEQDEAELS